MKLRTALSCLGRSGPSLIEFVMNHIRTGAERAGRDPKRIYTLCMTAFHLTSKGEQLETSKVRKAVGPFVSSSSNIFAFSCPDPNDLPADLRDDLMAFKMRIVRRKGLSKPATSNFTQTICKAFRKSTNRW